jgi:hypothetical protein
VAAAARPTGVFFSAGTGVRVPTVLSLTGLVEVLLEPPAERDPLGEELPEPELVALDPDRFTDAQWAQVEAAFAGAAPVRLSAALTRARAVDPDLAPLVVLRALHWLGTSIATARSQGDEAVRIAVDDGAVLHDPEFGGADLLIGTARILDDAVEDVA